MNLERNDEAIMILNSLRNRFEKILQESSGGRYPLNQMPSIYALLNEKEEALRYLSEFAKQGFNGGMQDLVINSPLYEYLWDDREFKAIVKREQEKKASIRTQIRKIEERGELDLWL
jgi:hypothetical protein